MTYQQTERWQLSQFPNETLAEALRDAEKAEGKAGITWGKPATGNKAEPMGNARKFGERWFESTTFLKDDGPQVWKQRQALRARCIKQGEGPKSDAVEARMSGSKAKDAEVKKTESNERNGKQS